MIVLNALFPVVVLLAIGWLLKKSGLTDAHFLKTSDQLVYSFFFPLMLFWKIGSSSFTQGHIWGLCAAVLLALVCMFFLSWIAIVLFSIQNFQAGTFAQSCYRFNTYIGVAVIVNTLDQQGIAYFGVLIGIAIPLINLVAVLTLLHYAKDHPAGEAKGKYVFRSILSNPLIIGCLAGIVYSLLFEGYPLFIDNSLKLISSVTLPLALLSIGGILSVESVWRDLPLSLLASVCKLVIFPVVGYITLKLFQVEGVPFTVGMIFFALPTSTAIYVLSSQLKSDTGLASAAIAVSTVLSFPVLSLVLLLSRP